MPEGLTQGEEGGTSELASFSEEPSASALWDLEREFKEFVSIEETEALFVVEDHGAVVGEEAFEEAIASGPDEEVLVDHHEDDLDEGRSAPPSSQMTSNPTGNSTSIVSNNASTPLLTPPNPSY